MFEPMPDLTVGLLLVAGVLALPGAARLWRAERLSDRTMAWIVIGWAPATLFAYGLIRGTSLLFISAAAILLLPGLVLYRTILDLIREQRSVVK